MSIGHGYPLLLAKVNRGHNSRTEKVAMSGILTHNLRGYRQ